MQNIFAVVLGSRNKGCLLLNVHPVGRRWQYGTEQCIHAVMHHPLSQRSVTGECEAKKFILVPWSYLGLVTDMKTLGQHHAYVLLIT